MKVARPVLNGEDEETGRKVLRLVLTQPRGVYHFDQTLIMMPKWEWVSKPLHSIVQYVRICACKPCAFEVPLYAVARHPSTLSTPMAPC